MIIGVPMECKPQEFRVSLTPSGVDLLVRAGHSVLVQSSAGLSSGLTDEEYAAAGAAITEDPAEVYRAADLVVKVKEPQPQEYSLLRSGQTLFTYLHLAPDKALTRAVLTRKVIAIGYETVEFPDGGLPLLAPMSEVAGRMAIQVGARLLEQTYGGMGVLLGGVPGVAPGHVMVLGAGNVGVNAIKMAVGLGAQVTVLDVSLERLTDIDDHYRGRVTTLVSTPYNIAAAVRQADLVVSTVHLTGALAPRLITEEMVKEMRPGSVIIDVAVDQGGSVETIDHVTTHENPTYVKHGVVHYAVSNMPGAVPRTSTYALTNATLPYIRAIADKGPEEAMRADPSLRRGLNAYLGKLTNQPVAETQGVKFTPSEEVF